MVRDFTRQYVQERSKKFRVHANRLGKLCVLWSSLELDVSLLLYTLTGTADVTVKNTLLGLMEFREKVRAVLAIGFKHKPSDDWYDRLQQTLHEIDERIRPERNRMIHDFWTDIPKDGSVRRMQITPKVVNVQSRQKQLIMAIAKPVTAKDISDLCKKIERASETIIKLDREYEKSLVK